jgi:hypothetical protein
MSLSVKSLPSESSEVRASSIVKRVLAVVFFFLLEQILLLS